MKNSKDGLLIFIFITAFIAKAYSSEPISGGSVNEDLIYEIEKENIVLDFNDKVFKGRLPASVEEDKRSDLDQSDY